MYDHLTPADTSVSPRWQCQTVEGSLTRSDESFAEFSLAPSQQILQGWFAHKAFLALYVKFTAGVPAAFPTPRQRALPRGSPPSASFVPCLPHPHYISLPLWRVYPCLVPSYRLSSPDQRV